MTIYTPMPVSRWESYSQVLSRKILNPRNAGIIGEERIHAGMRLVIAKEEEGKQKFFLFLLVDEQDGVIADAKFQAYGSPALIGLGEAACEFLLRKNYMQAKRITADLLERCLKMQHESAALPKEELYLFNLVIEAIDEAASSCMDIPISESELPSPFFEEAGEPLGEVKNFFSKSKAEKIALIERVIQEEIRPYIELDAGGIEIVDLENHLLTIRYAGTCTSCPSSIGGTLNAIQSILSARLSPDLIVRPDDSFLKQFETV